MSGKLTIALLIMASSAMGQSWLQGHHAVLIAYDQAATNATPPAAWSPPSGCILWLDADNPGDFATGTWTDQSGAGNHATQATDTKRGSVANGYWDNDGSDDYWESPTGILHGKDRYTICLWVRNNGWGIFNRWIDVADVGINMCFYQTSDAGTFATRYLRGSAVNTAMGGSSSAWRHVAVTTVDVGGTWKEYIYIDGAYKADLGAISLSFSVASVKWQFGRFNGGGYHANADYDDIMFFDVPLTASQIENIYNNTGENE